MQTHFFDFGSVAAVDRKLFRSADAWDGFSFAGSPTGEEGGSEKPWKQRLRVKSAQGEEALNLHCAKKCRGRDVRVRALNVDGVPSEFEADGLLAVCVQHEMDHLRGKVFVEYLSPLKRNRIKSKLQKEERELKKERQPDTVR